MLSFNKDKSVQLAGIAGAMVEYRSREATVSQKRAYKSSQSVSEERRSRVMR